MHTSAEKTSFTSYQKWVIAILALLQFTVVLDFMILSPLGDILMKQLQMTTSQFGTVVSAYAISAGISGFLAAGIADRFDRKRLLLFFYIGFIIGTISCGLAYNYQSLFAARMLTGVFGGVISSISMAIITDLFSLQQRGRVMGTVQTAFAGSQILGIPLGLYIADKLSWSATFYMVALLGIAVGLLLVAKLKPINAHLVIASTKSPLLHLWHTIRKRDYRIGFLATSMLSLGGFLLMPFTSAFLVNNVSIAQSQLPMLFFATGVASIIIMPIVGRIADKHDKFRLFTIGSVIAAIMVVIYCNLSTSPLWLVIGINVVLFMGIMSRMVPAMALNSAMPDLHDRGAYMSINSSLQQLSGGIAALSAGLIVHQAHDSAPLQHFDTLGYVMVAIMAITLVLVYRVDRIIKSQHHS